MGDTRSGGQRRPGGEGELLESVRSAGHVAVYEWMDGLHMEGTDYRGLSPSQSDEG